MYFLPLSSLCSSMGVVGRAPDGRRPQEQQQQRRRASRAAMMYMMSSSCCRRITMMIGTHTHGMLPTYRPSPPPFHLSHASRVRRSLGLISPPTPLMNSVSSLSIDLLHDYDSFFFHPPGATFPPSLPILPALRHDSNGPPYDAGPLSSRLSLSFSLCGV